MRPRNKAARDHLAGVLRRRSAASTAELAAQAGVSVPTLHRLLQELGDALVTTGKARRTRHALRRPLRGDLAALPLYRIDELGQADQIAQLALVHPQGSCLDLTGSAWPVPDESRDGWWAGLPYPLYDMRPQGYLGRQLARAEHQALGLAPNPEAWGDDDVVQVLSRAGSDVSGNLILGNPAFLQWQARKLAPLPALQPLPARALGSAYAGLAEQAIAAGVAGSSAAGEFPKFPALRELAGSDTPHVLVKFSGADGSPAVQRWSDLLVCEHLALKGAAQLPGLHSARSRIVQHAGRTFLELERFDRHGQFGRSALLSLATAAAALLGDGSTDWLHLARRLHSAGWLGADALPHIDQLVWFGRLIANSDMHTGNLSFRPLALAGRAAPAATLQLAPVYDMLPMHYAPLPGGEVPPRSFEAPTPLPAQRTTWLLACAAAIAFWARAAQDKRISAGFRACAGPMHRVCNHWRRGSENAGLRRRTRHPKESPMMNRRWMNTLGLLLACASLPAAAQTPWPSKPIRIVLQFPPGGSTDAVARILAQPLSAALGQPVLVDNRPGADGAIAGDHVARAEPDGHTFFLASNTPMMQVPLLKKNPPYDPVKSFTPVTLVGRYVYVLVSTPALPAKDVGELMAYARANPGKLSYGSYSGVTQLMHTQLKLARADTTLVPYKGEGPTVTDILGNHVQFTFATPASTLAHIKDGKLRALAVLLPVRSSLLPGVPTAAEAGLPPLTAGTWAALFGPARLPAEITQRMNREFNAAMQRPEVRERISALGFELAGSTPDEMAGFLGEQLIAWGRAFRDAGMTPE